MTDDIEAAVRAAKKTAFHHTWHPRECRCIAGQTVFTCPAVDDAIRHVAAVAQRDALRDMLTAADAIARDETLTGMGARMMLAGAVAEAEEAVRCG